MISPRMNTASNALLPSLNAIWRSLCTPRASASTPQPVPQNISIQLPHTTLKRNPSIIMQILPVPPFSSSTESPTLHTLGTYSSSLTTLNTCSVRAITISPPSFRNSFGIPSSPTALPLMACLTTFLTSSNVISPANWSPRTSASTSLLPLSDSPFIPPAPSPWLLGFHTLDPLISGPPLSTTAPPGPLSHPYTSLSLMLTPWSSQLQCCSNSHLISVLDVANQPPFFFNTLVPTLFLLDLLYYQNLASTPLPSPSTFSLYSLFLFLHSLSLILFTSSLIRI